MNINIAICTWFGCGLLKPAPGTWGTLGAVAPGLLLMLLGGWPALLVGIAVVLVAGLWATDRYEKETQTHDSGQIVIDEVAGFWMALLGATLTPLSVILAFALFRGFDILKPWPVSWADRKLPGAWGVMVDDLIAGAMAAGCLWGLRHYAGLG